MRKPLILLLLAALLLLMAGCGTQQTTIQPLPGETPFAFTVDPGNETVTLVAQQPSQGLTTATSGSGHRALVPGTDLTMVDYSYRFEADNKLVIDATFANIDDIMYFDMPFYFLVDPQTSNIESSVEPLVDQDHGLELDGVLSPDETTSTVRFEVTHKGEPFSYVVDAYADVVNADELGFWTRGSIQLPDGKMIVGGHSRVGSIYSPPADPNQYPYTHYYSLGLMRFEADGSLDTDFGRGGLAHVYMGSDPLYAFGLALQDEGAIVIASEVYHSGSSYYKEAAIARFHADGSPDLNFGSDGITSFSPQQRLSIEVEPDGTMLLSGYGNSYFWEHIFIVYPDGSTLETFRGFHF